MGQQEAFLWAKRSGHLPTWVYLALELEQVDSKSASGRTQVLVNDQRETNAPATCRVVTTAWQLTSQFSVWLKGFLRCGTLIL